MPLVQHPLVDPPRVATPDDADRVVEILVGAFHDDPTWSWAFPDPVARPAQYRRFWRLFVDGALRYPCVWLTGDASATAVWIPPGGTEMSQEQEDLVAPLVVDLLGDRAGPVLQLFEAFDRAHPREEPHYYLTLLGTHPDHWGLGVGLGLLAATLQEVDRAAMPAYLEASNPVNVDLYARYGFHVHGSFPLPDRSAEVITMWRPAAEDR